MYILGIYIYMQICQYTYVYMSVGVDMNIYIYTYINKCMYALICIFISDCETRDKAQILLGHPHFFHTHVHIINQAYLDYHKNQTHILHAHIYVYKYVSSSIICIYICIYVYIYLYIYIYIYT